jgi:transposase InsO family protein
MMVAMRDLLGLIWHAVVGLFRPRAALEAEILTLRHQINILRRGSPKRVALGNIDRAVLIGLYRLTPTVLEALKIINPATLVRWHRAGFRWKSRPHGGRPKTPVDIRRLIREMSITNPLWGAPRIHGELLKLGIVVGQTTVAKYMARRRGPPSQGWTTFLRNHADGIAAMDLFVVPTMSFRLLYGLLILRHDRREISWLAVTRHPTAEWIARQLTEAFGWETAPRYLLRDRDQLYGNIFVERVRAMGIRDRLIAPRSPWQNAYCERAIGSIRRDCLDHVIVFGERHLRHLLQCYATYYNQSRTHLSLNKDAPARRPVQDVGCIDARPTLGGLHHRYGLGPAARQCSALPVRPPDLRKGGCPLIGANRRPRGARPLLESNELSNGLEVARIRNDNSVVFSDYLVGSTPCASSEASIGKG